MPLLVGSRRALLGVAASPPPVFVGVSTAQPVSGTSHAIAVPAAAQPGDLLVLAAVNSGNTVAVTDLGGMTAIRNVLSGTSSYGYVTAYRIMQIGDATITLTTASAVTLGLILVAYRGVNQSSPLITDAQTESASSVNCTAPTITPGLARTLNVVVYSARNAVTFTPPAGYTERGDLQSLGARSVTLVDAIVGAGATGGIVGVASGATVNLGDNIAFKGA